MYTPGSKEDVMIHGPGLSTLFRFYDGNQMMATYTIKPSLLCLSIHQHHTPGIPQCERMSYDLAS